MTEGGAVDVGAMGVQALFQTLAARDVQDPHAEQAARVLLRWLHARLAAHYAPSRGEESDAQNGDADDVWASAAPSANAAAAGTELVPRVGGAVTGEIYAEICKALPQWLAPVRHSPIPLTLWLQWMEIGSCVHDLQRIVGPSTAARNGIPPEQVIALMKNAKAPVGFPAANAYCDAQQQIAFSCSLWDVVVSCPVQSFQATTATQEARMYEERWSQRLDVFVHWMAQAMRGYDVVFLNNVGASLIAHIQSSLPHRSRLLSNEDVAIQKLQTLIGAKPTDNQWQKHASSIAIMVLVQHALPNAHEDAKVASVIDFLGNLVVSKLKMDAFPHTHDPLTIVGVAIGIASTTATTKALNGSIWTSVLVQQFSLLRCVNLSLISFQVGANEQQSQRLANMRKVFQDNLARVIHSNNDAGMVALLFQMTEACVVEALGFFRRSAASYKSLLQALQSVYPPELLRDVLVKYAAGSTDKEATSKADTRALLEYLKTLYDTVASTLQVLTETQRGNHSATLLAFLMLSKLEFARETCSSRERNAFMITLTQRLEDAIEAMPEPVLSRMFRSVSNRDALAAWSAGDTDSGDSSILQEVDIILSCQVLVVGLVMQRKLRVLLFQSSALMDEAIALVFMGLYNGYEPLDTFAHRFLGFCLTHLGQYISINDIVPHYLQLTLDKYPENANQDTIARTCGVIFGALYYASSLATSAASGDAFFSSPSVSAGLSSQQRMVLWALKKCCDRVAELMLAPETTIISSKALDSANSAQDAKEPQDAVVTAKEKPLEPNTTTKSGLYLSGIVFELLKMGPLELLVQMAMEIELLLSTCAVKKEAIGALKEQLFASISQHCDAEKRAWLAAWYVELANLYSNEDADREDEDTAKPHARL
ncbi:hypothetical protein FI667_g15770, partial [Globisporangium splendens]